MCSANDGTYLEIVPRKNPGITYIQNDSVGNMYFEIKLFIGKESENP
jgi:hypothetical protein